MLLMALCSMVLYGEGAVDSYAIAKGCLTIVQGELGLGSGFVAEFEDGGKYFVTNRHVIEDEMKFCARLLNGRSLQLGSFQWANDGELDLVRFRVSEDTPALRILQDTPEIGQKISILGNADGKGVVTHLRGEIVGVGPDIIEVTAKFVHGNSGSPILDDRGRVLGVATFATYSKEPQDWMLNDSPYVGIRRFGIRLSGVKWSSLSFKELVPRLRIMNEKKVRERCEVATRYRLSQYNSIIAEYLSGVQWVVPEEDVLRQVSRNNGGMLFQDGWDRDLSFTIVSNCSVLASSGADAVFGTFDDLSVTNNCVYQESVLRASEKRESERLAREQAIARDAALKREKRELEQRAYERALEQESSLKRARLVSNWFSDIVQTDLGHRVDTWKVPCAHSIFMGPHEVFMQRQLENVATFFGLSFDACFLTLDRQGVLERVSAQARGGVSQQAFESFAALMESGLGLKFRRSELCGVISMDARLADGRHLRVDHSASDSLLHLQYFDPQQTQVSHREMSKRQEKEYQTGLTADYRTDFLGVRLLSFFEDYLDLIKGKMVSNDEAVLVKFKPKVRFRDFTDYTLGFDKRNGQVEYIACSKVVGLGDELNEDIKDILCQLERCYGRVVLLDSLQKDEAVWAISYYLPRHMEIEVKESPFESLKGMQLVNNYERSHSLAVTLKRLPGYQGLLDVVFSVESRQGTGRGKPKSSTKGTRTSGATAKAKERVKAR